MSAVSPNLSFRVGDLPPNTFLADVLSGLSREPKALPPKYFYDVRGCELFDAICELPEYYLTRTETALMRARVNDMARAFGPRAVLVEFGSGNSQKTRILLDALAPHVYVAVDIAQDELRKSAAQLARERPRLHVVAVCADFTRPFPLPVIEGNPKGRVLYFSGSTIGNLTPGEAKAFLSRSIDLAGPRGAMLVGVDLKKDKARLDAAYDDAAGVTAAFNLNLLQRINRELDADFDVARFRHVAFYDERAGRVEMHLESLAPQRVTVGGRTFAFRSGETIHTESSYKYGIEEFQELAQLAGWKPASCWTDADRLFAVHYLAAP